MLHDSVLCDLTSFLDCPDTTGIQRVSLNIVDHWDSSLRLVPVRYPAENGGLAVLPDEALHIMREYFWATEDDLPRYARDLSECASKPDSEIDTDDFPKITAILNPELFYDPRRVGLYDWLATFMRDRLFFIVYDFIPWLHPETFLPGTLEPTWGYVRMIRGMKHLAFISEQTRQDFVGRILRQEHPTGIVLSLGSDGLGTASPCFSADKRGFGVLGSIVEYKNHLLVLDAFESLWRRGVDTDLTFIGKIRHLPEGGEERLRSMHETQPHFRWLEGMGDKRAAEAIKNFRATIFVSSLEGFGLPPLESLALGVPVIASASMPSIEMIEPLGQIRLSEVTPASIRRAVLEMLDDQIAEQKCREIEDMTLPTWQDMGHHISQWIQKTVEASPPPGTAGATKTLPDATEPP